MKKYAVFLILFNSLIIYSQEKFEKEYRIKEDKVPKSAVEFISSLDFQKKVKWFAEESNDGKTFEAKVVYNKHKCSIEFSEQGEFIDLEKEVKFNSIESKNSSTILKNLRKEFLKFRIKKVQLQYIGNESDVYKTLFQSTTSEEIVKPNYEIVIKAKKDKSYSLYEILFNSQGKIIKQLKFKPTSSLNLEF